MGQVLEVAERVKQLSGPPRHILVGGPAVRMGLELDPSLGIQACRQLSEVLPLLQEDRPGGAPASPTQPRGQGKPDDPGHRRGSLPKNVFVVDDDEDFGFLMARMLKKGGVRQVKTFTGGEAVMHHLHSGECPDLVILDQNMPGMDGVQTLALIHRMHPEMPVLVSSGQSGLDDWAEFRHPRVGVLAKPSTLEEIREWWAQFTRKDRDNS
jgi:CheY-like chemotaxis protein